MLPTPTPTSVCGPPTSVCAPLDYTPSGSAPDTKKNGEVSVEILAVLKK